MTTLLADAPTSAVEKVRFDSAVPGVLLVGDLHLPPGGRADAVRAIQIRGARMPPMVQAWSDVEAPPRRT